MAQLEVFFFATIVLLRVCGDTFFYFIWFIWYPSTVLPLGYTLSCPQLHVLLSVKDSSSSVYVRFLSGAMIKRMIQSLLQSTLEINQSNLSYYIKLFKM